MEENIQRNGTNIYFRNDGMIDITPCPGSPIRILSPKNKNETVDPLVNSSFDHKKLIEKTVDFFDKKQTENLLYEEICDSNMKSNKDDPSNVEENFSEMTPCQELQQLKETLKRLNGSYNNNNNDNDIKYERSTFSNSAVFPLCEQDMNDIYTYDKSHTNFEKSKNIYGNKISVPETFVNIKENEPRNIKEETPSYLNRSKLSSLTRADPNLQGSKAVLSAMRALQDKIRRLEEDKREYLNQLSELKSELRKKDHELQGLEKKQFFELTKAKEYAQKSYENLREEKDDLRIKLVQLQERNSMQTKETEYYKSHAKEINDSFQESNRRLKNQEEKYEILKQDFNEAKIEAENIVLNLKQRLTESRDSDAKKEKRIIELEGLIIQENKKTEILEKNLIHAEDKLDAMKTVNNELVERFGTNKTKLIKNKKNILPGSIQEILKKNSINEPKKHKLVTGIQRNTIIKNTNEINEHSQSINKKINSILRSTNSNKDINKKKPTAMRTRRQTSRLVNTNSINNLNINKKNDTKTCNKKNNMQLLTEANAGREVPFILGTSSTPSFSLIGSVQNSLKNAALYEESAPDRRERMPEPITFDNKKLDENLKSPIKIPNNTKDHEEYKKKNDIKLLNPLEQKEKIQSNITKVVESVEKEFQELNHRYHQIMSKIETNNSSKSNIESTDINEVKMDPSEISSIIDSLENKGNQLTLMKETMKQIYCANFERSVIHSPAAIKKKNHAIRILQEYRNMEKDNSFISKDSFNNKQNPTDNRSRSKSRSRSVSRSFFN